MKRWVEEMIHEQEENEKLLVKVNRELRYAPKGNLSVSHYRGAARFYRAMKGTRKMEYLGEKKMAERYLLAQKKYNELLKEAIIQEQSIIASSLQLMPPTPSDVFEQMSDDMKPFISPHVLPDEEFVKRWLEEYSETASGDKFKSRVEVIIHDDYEKYNVPCVYEPQLYLEGYGPARPDFAVLNVRTRQTFYHEHFGMMDKESYRRDNIHKLRCYHHNGFFEGVNLIVTMEGDGEMIDYRELEEVIVKYCK